MLFFEDIATAREMLSNRRRNLKEASPVGRVKFGRKTKLKRALVQHSACWLSSCTAPRFVSCASTCEVGSGQDGWTATSDAGLSNPSMGVGRGGDLGEDVQVV